MYSVPVAMLVDIFFLLCWRFLLPRVPQDWALSKQVAFVVATTLAVWLLLAGVVALMLTHIFTSTSQLALAGSFALVGSVVAGLLACVTPPEAPTGQNKVPPKILVARGVCAGTAISIAIALSGLSGVVGGIFAVFPAIFYTTMIGKHRFLPLGGCVRLQLSCHQGCGFRKVTECRSVGCLVTASFACVPFTSCSTRRDWPHGTG